MTVYVDAEYKCHINNPDEDFRAFEILDFDGKCDAYIEGYRYIPAGESWTREDGVVFMGEMIAPWKDYSVLAAAQAEYERNAAEMADMQEALALLGVTVDE